MGPRLSTVPYRIGRGVTASVREGVGTLPLFVEAGDDGLKGDLDRAVAWLGEYRGTLDELLLEHGGLVFRGFPVDGAQDFRSFVADYGFSELSYRAGSTNRVTLHEDVYRATAHPPDVLIPLHQEMAYLPSWPTRLAFHCHVAPQTGGATILGNVRQVEPELPAVVRELVREHGILYRRNFRALEDGWDHHPTFDSIHKPWTVAFETDSPEQAERYCAELGLAFAWEDDGSLTTEFRAAGFTVHPVLGSEHWFNQMHAQTMSLRTYGPDNFALLERLYPPGRPRPYDTRLGDGSPVPSAWIEQIYDVLEANTVAFPWQEGDVMIIDNVLTAHGRSPFSGDRDIQVAMLT